MGILIAASVEGVHPPNVHTGPGGCSRAVIAFATVDTFEENKKYPDSDNDSKEGVFANTHSSDGSELDYPGTRDTDPGSHPLHLSSNCPSTGSKSPVG